MLLCIVFLCVLSVYVVFLVLMYVVVTVCYRVVYDWLVLVDVCVHVIVLFSYVSSYLPFVCMLVVLLVFVWLILCSLSLLLRGAVWLLLILSLKG